MTPAEIRSLYSFRILRILEQAAAVFRTAGFTAPSPLFGDTAHLTNHTFWWTDVEDNRNTKFLQLQFMAAVSEELGKGPGLIRFSFCLIDLQFGRFLGCRESEWVDRNDAEAVEEAFFSVESRLPILLTQIKKLADGLK